MNLLDKYISAYSGHVQSITCDERERRIEIVFLDRPEAFNPVLKLVFEKVSELHEEQFEERDENDIELLIGFDLDDGCYYLHTDSRELNFKAAEVVEIPLGA